MPAELLIAPVGAGKTGHALDRLAAIIQAEPFARAWVILPTARQEDAFRERLVQHERARRVYFNIEFFNFYSLYKYLLDSAGMPQRELDAAARLRLLRETLRQLQAAGSLHVYGRIAEKPGFARQVADFIYELKQNLIRPEAFRAAATSPKDHDLASIYESYQAVLQDHDLVDREGEGWLALEALGERHQIGREVRLLLVDGFDQFSPLQARLVARLTGRAQETLIPIPTAPGREQTVGQRFEEARLQLHQAFAAEGFTPAQTSLPEIKGSRHAALRHLNHQLFLPAAPIPSDDRIHFLEAPDPVQEAAAVLRQVKRLLLEGTAPDDILVTVRDTGRYAGPLAEAGRRYGLPLALQTGEPLAENPAVIALLQVLQLAPGGFRRRAVLDALRSPYVTVEGLDTAALDQLGEVARAQLVIGGQAEWLSALDRASQASDHEDDERQVLAITPTQAAALRGPLSHCFARVTPPPVADVRTYIGWIESLMGDDPQGEVDDDQPQGGIVSTGLGILANARGGGPSALVDRDLAALQQFKRVLKGLLAAQNLLTALQLGTPAQLPWAEFLAEVERAVQVTAVDQAAKRAGKVLVTTVNNGRGLPHQHLFILGLSEGLFPSPATEDRLYLDSERLAFRARGLHLETSAERTGDDGLFYELISQARESLTLSRPTLQQGVPWPESSLWRAVRLLYTDAAARIQRDRLGPGQVVAVSQAATEAEARLALAKAFTEPDAEHPPEAAAALYNHLLARGDATWRNIWRGQQIERRRMSRGPHDMFSGRLGDPALIAHIAAELGPDHLWSASQFTELGQCGFRFFSRRILKLDALEEPEDGLDSRRRGTLIHSILEDTYRELLGLPITPENEPHALAVLRRVAAQAFQEAPATLGFRPSPLWAQARQTILRALERTLRQDFSAGGPTQQFGSAPRTPYRLEQPFSPATPPALPLTLAPGGEALAVTGFIDRIDRQGDRIILIDYKTGSSKIPTSEMARGRNYQMMIYLLSARAILEQDESPDRPTAVAGGFFWHLGNQQSSGVFDLEDTEDRANLEAGQAHLTRQIGLARAGDFGGSPNRLEKSKCYPHCQYATFCRVQVMGRGKR